MLTNNYALLLLSLTIKKLYNGNVVIFLWFKRDFETVILEHACILVKTLEHVGIGGTVLKCLINYLGNRQ